MKEKYTKNSVGFEDPARGPHHCSQCVHFLGNSKHKCEIVAGKVDADDWCRKFKLRRA